MVSFTCPVCQDVVKKPKVLSHAAVCGARQMSCIDCMKVFDLGSIKDHTACVSEVQKYQGKWKGPAPTGKKAKLDTSDEEEEEQKRKEEAAKAAANSSGKGAAVRRPRMMTFSDTDMSDDEKQQNSKSDKKPKASKEVPEKKQPISKSPVQRAVSPPSKKQADQKQHPVEVSFQLASSPAAFQQHVQSQLGARWSSGESVSAKAAAKVLAEDIVNNKQLRASLQHLVATHCGENVSVQ